MTSAGLDWDREKWRGSVASKFIRGGEKNAVKYADEIIVLSKDVQKYFLETYGRKTHFIPNGVNRPEVREAKLITDHFGLEKDSYILFLGRLVPEKGIRYLVEAFKNVKTDKKLVIAGGSSDTDSFMPEQTPACTWKKFYAPHRRAHEPLHNYDCIYTPGIVVFKSDTDYPQLLPEEKWYSVNVLTCAAPNLRERPSNEMNAGDGDAAVHISREDLQALHEKRMRRVLEIAWAKGNEVIILGAFGCGAFRNPPAIVAQAMKTVVQEYRMRFEIIEFAVYCGAQYDTNYRVFQQVLGGM